MKIFAAVIMHGDGNDLVAALDEESMYRGIAEYCQNNWGNWPELPEIPDDPDEIREVYFSYTEEIVGSNSEALDIFEPVIIR